jgi:prepilin-type N-terminal cleavage/methylation domain-containing protein
MRTLTQRGFSLVELAIVLVIVGLLIGGLLTPLATQFEQRRISETQRLLEETREALVGFALRNGYLPCPAVSAQNGLEDRSAGYCTGGKRQGFIPWATLGVQRADGWGRMLRYSVTPAFSNSQLLFNLGTPRDITIGTRDESGNLVAATGIGDIPAVVMSHGRNGYGGFSELGVPVGAEIAGNVDERANAGPAGIAFVSRTPSDASAPGGEFDDLVVWVSPNILYSRMVAGGVLPR